MLIHRDGWQYSGQTPAFFSGQSGCYCCAPPPPPPSTAYYYQRRRYYRREITTLNGCWGCGPLTLPETLTCTVEKLTAGCPCGIEESFPLTWQPDASVVLNNGTTYTISCFDFDAGAGNKVGLWVSDLKTSLCYGKVGTTGSCVLENRYRVGMCAGYPYQISPVAGGAVGFGLCSLFIIGVDTAFAEGKISRPIGASDMLATSCSPFAISSSDRFPWDYTGLTLFSIYACETGCSRSSGTNWKYTVTE